MRGRRPSFIILTFVFLLLPAGTGAELALAKWRGTTWGTGMARPANQTMSTDKIQPKQKRQTLSQAISSPLPHARARAGKRPTTCICLLQRALVSLSPSPLRSDLEPVLQRFPCLLSIRCWLFALSLTLLTNTRPDPALQQTLQSSLCSLKPAPKPVSPEKDSTML